jgi:hypothetical protein
LTEKVNKWLGIETDDQFLTAKVVGLGEWGRSKAVGLEWQAKDQSEELIGQVHPTEAVRQAAATAALPPSSRNGGQRPGRPDAAQVAAVGRIGCGVRTRKVE